MRFEPRIERVSFLLCNLIVLYLRAMGLFLIKEDFFFPSESIFGYGLELLKQPLSEGKKEPAHLCRAQHVYAAVLFWPWYLFTFLIFA